MATAFVMAEGSTIVDVAVKDGRFTTLVAALKAAKLDTTLMGQGPCTVFAPPDEAFAKLPAGTVSSTIFGTQFKLAPAANEFYNQNPGLL